MDQKKRITAHSQVVDEQGVPYTTSQVLSAEPWTPSPYTAFKVSNASLLSYNGCAGDSFCSAGSGGMVWYLGL